MGYVEFTSNTESPLSYHMWSGIACVAAALQRKVYMRWGHDEIFANNYVILVGPSGFARKGTAITIVRKFIRELGFPMIGEDNSVERIIDDIKNAVTTYKEGTIIRMQCATTCIVPEFAVFTGFQNTRLLSYLTDWFDSPREWSRKTKHQGQAEVQGMYFNLLAATAPDWIPYIFPREAVGGGFTSRCIFVVEDRKGKTIPDPNATPPDMVLRDKLRYDLEKITLMSGQFTFEKDALESYKDWYIAQDKKIDAGELASYDPALLGYLSRKATQVKKISMCLAASQSSDLKIKKSHFDRALQLLELMEQRFARVFSGVGKSRYAEEVEQILDFIRRRRKVSRGDVLKAFYRNIDGTALEAIEKVLFEMKMIKIERNTAKQETTYTYVGG